MMSKPPDIQWAEDLIEKLEDGMWWHIPRSNSILRIDKKRNRFVLIQGNMSEHRDIVRMLSKVGYHIIERDSE